MVSGSGIATITLVEVTLTIEGVSAWNGDYYAYLHHEGGTSILLNRIGKTASNTIGSGTVGLQITLSDQAENDIHDVTASSGMLTGSYQPDARNVDPDVAVNTTSRTAFLSTFQGMAADGEWTLFIADMSGGDQAVLVNWGLKITGAPIPEPSGVILLACGMSMVMFRRRAR